MRVPASRDLNILFWVVRDPHYKRKDKEGRNGLVRERKEKRKAGGNRRLRDPRTVLCLGRHEQLAPAVRIQKIFGRVLSSRRHFRLRELTLGVQFCVRCLDPIAYSVMHEYVALGLVCIMRYAVCSVFSRSVIF